MKRLLFFTLASLLTISCAQPNGPKAPPIPETDVPPPPGTTKEDNTKARKITQYIAANNQVAEAGFPWIGSSVSFNLGETLYISKILASAPTHFSGLSVYTTGTAGSRILDKSYKYLTQVSGVTFDLSIGTQLENTIPQFNQSGGYKFKELPYSYFLVEDALSTLKTGASSTNHNQRNLFLDSRRLYPCTDAQMDADPSECDNTVLSDPATNVLAQYSYIMDEDRWPSSYKKEYAKREAILLLETLETYGTAAQKKKLGSAIVMNHTFSGEDIRYPQPDFDGIPEHWNFLSFIPSYTVEEFGLTSSGFLPDGMDNLGNYNVLLNSMKDQSDYSGPNNTCREMALTAILYAKVIKSNNYDAVLDDFQVQSDLEFIWDTLVAQKSAGPDLIGGYEKECAAVVGIAAYHLPQALESSGGVKVSTELTTLKTAVRGAVDSYYTNSCDVFCENPIPRYPAEALEFIILTK